MHARCLPMAQPSGRAPARLAAHQARPDVLWKVHLQAATVAATASAALLTAGWLLRSFRRRQVKGKHSWACRLAAHDLLQRHLAGGPT